MKKYRCLKEILAEECLIGEEEWKRIEEMQGNEKTWFGDILIENGLLTERQLLDVICLQLDVPFVDLSKAPLDPDLIRVCPKNLARKHEVVPVRLENGALYLAMKNPMDFEAVEEVKMASRHPVLPMVAASNDIRRRFQELYGGDGVTKAIEAMAQEEETHGQNVHYLIVKDEESSSPTIRLVNSLLDRAAAERASDIHLEPCDEEMIVRMRIDGVLHEILKVPAKLQSSVITRIKVMGGMNITERRLPQDGRATVMVHGQKINLRIATVPVIYGEKVAIRLLNQSTELLSREALGLAGRNLDRFDRLLSRRNGVILVVGMTGSGKTSTLYTMIRELVEEGTHLITLEDPVEYHMDGVNQIAIHEKIGLTFAQGLRAVLRQDPDVIAVGEIRDSETAEVAMRSSLTGHLVLSTIHTNDALTSVERLKDIGVPSYLIARAVNGIIAQRLVRRICPNCRTAYNPDEREKRMFAVEGDEVQFYRGSGCSHCFHTGYRGRIGVFEILLMNQEARRCILQEEDRETLRQSLRDSDFVSMEEELKRLVLEGITTAEEAERSLRALSEDANDEV